MKSAQDSHRTAINRWLLPVLIGWSVVAWSSTASALPCVQDKFGSKVNCTANDIRISEITDIVVTDDGCAFVGDTVTFNATLTVVTTATERYDIGLFVGTDSVQAITGECEVFALPTEPVPPFEDADGDQCGDSSSAATLEIPVTGLTVACEDANDDNNLDIASCTTWQQNSDGDCTGAADVEPGTAAKCNCPITPTDVPIFVPDPVCVTNADCEALATGCNIGVCDVANPGADAFGCIFSPDDTLCDDGLFCNGEETCDAGVCADGAAPECNDGVSCTVDACDEANDDCTNTPDNTVCNDNQFCNGVETCDVTNGCTAGTAPNCADAVTCTTDTCDETNDVCVHTPVNASCNDGQFCNGVETCDVTNGCTAGTAPNCADAVTCTTDTCDETNDVCVHTPVNASCSDGQFCNGVETCDVTNGCTAGTAPNCADAVTCTTDTCDETNDVCVHTPVNASCNDGQFCNGVETCDVTNGCTAGTAPNCADAVTCTTDTCDETNDVCVHTPVNASCNDGQFCNGVETCDVTNGCTAGTAPNCADAVTCTTDTCDETNDVCVHTPVNASCSDGQFCNGVETCDVTNGCTAGTAPNCADAVTCTTDTCDETNDVCVHTPVNASCNDGQFCNGVETCDVTNGCTAGTPPVCADAVTCTVDTCDETNDVCVNTPSNALCNDGLFCNGDELCDETTGCTGGLPPLCDDHIDCSLDECDEANNECLFTGNADICDDGNECTTDVCDPIAGCEYEFICEGDICRSPGFWSTHGGVEKSGGNITQEVIDAAGGLEVCGQVITTTVNDDKPFLDGLGLTSALEGLCVRVQGESIRQLYRQLIAAALNCVVSGTGDCDTIVGNHTEISFDECNTLCAGGDVGDGPTIQECISQLDCFNNGGEVFEGDCTYGNCEITHELCGGDAGSCPLVDDLAQRCIDFPGNCHDAELCNEEVGVCVEGGGGASSSRACSEARGNFCTIDDCD